MIHITESKFDLLESKIDATLKDFDIPDGWLPTEQDVEQIIKPHADEFGSFILFLLKKTNPDHLTDEQKRVFKKLRKLSYEIYDIS